MVMIPTKAGIQRSLIRTAISWMFKMGKTGAETQRYIKGRGLKMRKQDFYRNWREITGAEKMAKAWKRIPRKYRIGENRFIPTAKPMRKKYRWVFEVRGYDFKTGLDDQLQYVSVVSDVKYRDATVMKRIEDRLRNKLEYYKFYQEFLPGDISLEIKYKSFGVK